MRFCILLALPLAAIAAVSSAQRPYAFVIRQALQLAEQHQFDSAAGILEQALDRAKREGKTVWISPILDDLGSIRQEQGKYFDAERYYRQSIAAARQMGQANRLLEASALGNLGTLYYEAGLYTKAEQVLSQSVSMIKAAGVRNLVLAESLNNIGVAYLAQHRDAPAESSAEDALKIWTSVEGPDSPGSAFSYSLLGAAYNHAGNVSEAESALLRAVEIWKKVYGPGDVRTAKATANVGAFYMDNGAPEKALPMFDEARPVFEKASLNDHFVVHFFQIDAELQKKLGNGKEAKNLRHEKDRLETSSLAHAVAGQIIDVSGLMPPGK